MAKLGHIKTIQRKESATKDEDAAKEKVADRVYVSGCEKALIEADEDP